MKQFKNMFRISCHRLHPFLLLLMLACVLAGCTSRKIIVNSLDEREANEILVFLDNKNIDAIKVEVLSEGGASKLVLWNISVDASQANLAMTLLNQAGLPRRKTQNLLNIFSNVGLVPSGMAEKIRYTQGMAEQIASTIRKFDGILETEVQLSFPEEDPLTGQPKGKIVAAVYVKHNGVLDDPNLHLMTRIKRLVSGSITGLDYDNVTVIGDRARYNEPSAQTSLGAEERHYVSVWGMIIATESLTIFRIIFFSFIISIILLILFLIWLIWKFLPVLMKAGGFKQLLNYHPIEPDQLVVEESKKVEEVVKPEVPKEGAGSETAGKGIDET